MSRSSLLILLTAPAALLVACGSDATSGAGATGAGGSTSATGSSSVASTVGAGGDSTSASTAGAGGNASTSTSTSTSTTGAASSTTGATGSTSTGAMMMGACTNAADLAIIMSKDIGKIVGDCASSGFGMEPGTKNCIKMGTGFSDPCVVCFDDTVSCVFKNCLGECIGGSSSPACKDCRAAKCDPAFTACSGVPAN
ncbi:MAG: hypothetical protein ABJE95_00540 [Byssovorax sp.]